MKKPNNLVSIILPVSNVETHLRECINSLLLQTYKDIEIIAVDDNSHDRSWQTLQEIRKQDKRLKIYKNIKRYGLTVTLNRTVKKAKGTYLAFMRADDKVSLHRINQQIKFLQANPKVAAVGTQTTYIGKNGRSMEKSKFPLTHEGIYPTLMQKTAGFYFESALINRMILPLDLIKFTDTVYPHVYNDVFLKITQYGQLANLPHYLYTCRAYMRNERKKQDTLSIISATAQLWLKSITQYEYRPSVRSLFSPATK